MHSPEFGLHRVSNAELTRLLRALHRGALPSPITRASLIEKAFGHIEAHLDSLIGRDLAAAKALVIAVLAERGQGSGANARASASLLYAGPPAPGTRSRDTLEQVRELLASASASAHLYGLRCDDDRGLLRTVGALLAGRDAAVRLVFASDDTSDPETNVRRFVSQRLPGEHARLELFVCTAARLRARAVVVDGARVLVTSGELTSREDDGFLDLGVRLEDVELARALEDEWSKLCATGAVRPVLRTTA